MNKKLFLYALFFCSSLAGMEGGVGGAFQLIHIIDKIIAADDENTEQADRELLLPEISSPYQDIKAVVSNTVVSEQEKKFLEVRDPIVREALSKLISQTITDSTKTVKIALAFSGGGYRAALGAIGSLRGLDKEGILDCTHYMIGLSGSTWAIGPWITTQMDLDAFSNYFKQCISKEFTDLSEEEKHLLAQMIALRKKNKQPHTHADIFGGLLANRLLVALKERRHLTTLSEQENIVKTGKYPYPFYAAINGLPTDKSWHTFSPSSFTNIEKKYSIPSYGVGRKFKNGESTNNALEEFLGQIFAGCGSAFGAGWEEIFRAVKEYEKTSFIGTYVVEHLEHVVRSYDPERPFHFELQIPNPERKAKDDKILKILDAGIVCNLPVPPVIIQERKADVIFVFDNSAGNIGEELIKCAEYAREHNLPFPAINKNVEQLSKKTIHIFEGKDTQTPTVIYLPGVSDEDLWNKRKHNPIYEKYPLNNFDLHYEANNGSCLTQDFCYPKNISDQVIKQTEFNVRANRKLMAAAIAHKMLQINQ